MAPAEPTFAPCDEPAAPPPPAGGAAGALNELDGRVGAGPSTSQSSSAAAGTGVAAGATPGDDTPAGGASAGMAGAGVIAKSAAAIRGRAACEAVAAAGRATSASAAGTPTRYGITPIESVIIARVLHRLEAVDAAGQHGAAAFGVRGAAHGGLAAQHPRDPPRGGAAGRPGLDSGARRG